MPEGCSGAWTRARTGDLTLFRGALYQLSYPSDRPILAYRPLVSTSSSLLVPSLVLLDELVDLLLGRDAEEARAARRLAAQGIEDGSQIRAEEEERDAENNEPDHDLRDEAENRIAAHLPQEAVIILRDGEVLLKQLGERFVVVGLWGHTYPNYIIGMPPAGIEPTSSR